MQNEFNGLALIRQSPFYWGVMITIESMSNPKIKELVRLRKSSRRRKELGLFLVEGRREIVAMLENTIDFEEIYFCRKHMTEDSLDMVIDKFNGKTEIIELTTGPMKKASYRDGSCEMIGVVKTWDLHLPKIEEVDKELILVLDEVEKPGNLGSILRTAEAMGVKAVFLSDSCVDYFNPNTVRSSMGLFSSLPVYSGTKNEIWDWLCSAGLRIIGTSSNVTSDINELEFSNGTAFVMGSESMGLGDFWTKRLKEMVAIPMVGRASSLNLNAATACILMEFNRKSNRV
tara:strand:+ start:173 stop:1033 length:861 start_codon:yes stop_codon:yes gene_type:complete